jgi:hypothetical protein
MPRGRLPSVPELDERLRKVEEQVTGSHDLPPSLSSTPPPLRWLQRFTGKWLLKLAAALLLGAATWWGGWLARDCQTHLRESAPASTDAP